MPQPPSNPAIDAMRGGIDACASHARPFKAVVFRAASPAYAKSADLVTGRGALTHPGRWNQAGLARVVYASLEPETALAESLSHHRYYQIPVDEALPKVIASIEVSLRRVLDLHEQAVLRALKLRLGSLTREDWRRASASGRLPASHAVGAAAFAAGLEGLIVPSAAREGSANLVVFPDNLAAGSGLAARGLERPS